MTRKKSNVKALALAVTCAILAGGGIGLKPVYAVEALYKENSKGYITADATGATGNIVDATKWKLTVIDSGLKIGNIDLGLTKKGAITAESLTLADNYNVKTNIEDAKSRITVAEGKITTVEGNLSTNQANLTALQGRVDGHDTDINALKTKTQDIKYENDGSTTVDGVNFNGGAVSGVTSINNTHVGGVTLSGGTIEAASGKFKVYDNGAIEAVGGVFKVGSSGTINALGIQTHSNGSITLNDKLLLNAADASLQDIAAGKAVSVAEMANTRDNTKQISYDDTNGTKIDSDVIINKGEKNQVKITKDEGIVVGLDSSVVNADGVFAGGHDYDNAKAALNASDGSIKGADGKFSVEGTTGNVTTKGDIKGKDITASGKLTVDSDATVGGNLGVNGDTTLKGKLDVTGDTTVGGDLTVTKKIKGQSLNIGATGSEFTVDTVGHMTSKSAKIGSVGIDNTGAITGVTSLTTDALTVTGAFTTGNLTVNGDLTASGAINGKTISINDGGSIAGVNFENGGKLTATTGTIGDVKFAAGGSVSGISELTATTIKDGAGTIITGGNVESKTATIGAIRIVNETIESSAADGLSIENVKINNGAVSGVTSLTADSATIGSVNTLDNKGLTVKTGSKVQVGTNTVIEDGSVKVSQKTSLTDQRLQLNDTNKWTQEGGLVADKATVNGVVLGAAQGKATFTDDENKVTTILGDKITTGTITADKLLIDKISLGRDGNDNISIDKNGDVTTNGDITVTGAGGETTVIDGAQATFGKDARNQTIISKGDITATAQNAADSQQSTLTHNMMGFKVEGKDKYGVDSSFGFDTSTGIGTFTGKDSTTTTVNGSVITSTKANDDTGVLDGSNLTLKKGDNQTVLDAGRATFKSDKESQHGGKETTIDGGVITTDTLNVQRINLGKEMVNSDGTTVGSNLSIDEHGNIIAAGGNFTVAGTDKDDNKGALHNEVGNTSFDTATTGASMKYKDGGVESKVAVEANRATVAAGDKASFVATTDNGGTATITGGTQTVTTTDKGTVFENTAHKNPFVENGATNTIINGNEITTGKITTDELVITGKGDAAGDGTGSLAFGGNGTIKSDVKKDGSTNNTQFTTDINGVNTMVTDGKITATTTENKVTAAGNRNTVTKGDDQKSEFKQELTSIGGVVTNGTINVAQKLDGEHGLLTNEVTDNEGKWSKLEQSGTGLTYTDSAKPDNATRIDSSDVSIGSATDPEKRINLSDLGQIDNLDDELKNRPEYKNGEEVGTAVGAINAEAAIRREEVARLDNRIDDVNNRVNKVGAMAAAIASLKSIGYDPQAPSEFSIGLGQYKGETGVAMGFFHYPNKNFMINVSLSTAGGETMGGIGATWRFGHKSPQKLLEEQREAQAKKELAAAEKYQAAAKLAKEAQERAEYAAKLARQAQVSADNAKAAADATQAKHFG